MAQKKVLYKLFALMLLMAFVLGACAKTEETPVVEKPAVVGPGMGLKCAPNCQYKDLVVGFLQTGSEAGGQPIQRHSMRPLLSLA
jgi:hypothetical protein